MCGNSNIRDKFKPTDSANKPVMLQNAVPHFAELLEAAVPEIQPARVNNLNNLILRTPLRQTFFFFIKLFKLLILMTVISRCWDNADTRILEKNIIISLPRSLLC